MTTAQVKPKTATSLAWELIDKCPWVLQSPEILIVLRVARDHDRGLRWTNVSNLEHGHSGGSRSNIKSLLERPRLNSERYPFFLTTPGDNGKTAYRLNHAWLQVAAN